MVLKRVLDTNAILYLLGGRLAKPLPEGEYYVSVISEMELLSYPLLHQSDLAKIQDFLADVKVVPLTNEVKDAAVRLRRQHGLKLPDAIIAATAMTLGARLLSNDAKLLRIPGLAAQEVRLTNT